MLLNYNEMVNFIEWIAKQENWPYFYKIIRNEDFKLSTFNELYKEYQNNFDIHYFHLLDI